MEYLLQMRNWTIICVFNLLQLIGAEFWVIKGVSFRRMNTVKPLEGYWQTMCTSLAISEKKMNYIKLWITEESCI
jgi:hypothetical protein